MAIRRTLVLMLVLLTGAGLIALLWQVLAPGGWTAAKLVMLTAFCATVPWTGLCLANGLIGFVLLVAGTEPVRAAFPPDDAAPPELPPTAIAVTVRDEDMRRVLPPLRRLLRELDLAGTGDAFAVFILSDTRDPRAAEVERCAVVEFRAADRDPSRVHYRWRTVNTGFKAGNIMEFVDRHAHGFELMLTLDADSVMSAAAVLRLVRAMQADPMLGIVQHLTVGLPASSAFARLFQFGMRAGMRTWATGQAWWQGDDGPYWGHNALVRIAAFRAHGRLPLLSGGRHILSHDQVEAALLRGAGWGVRVLPEEDGSWEIAPPALPEFLHRERRWLAGNLQYWHLFRLPGLRSMGRWQLAQAILLFAGVPFYVVFLAAAAFAAATDANSPFPAMPAGELTLGWLGALYAPKLLGYLEVGLSPHKRQRYGGLARFAAGTAAEFTFMLLVDAVSAVAKTGAVLRLACGARQGWTPQNRSDRGVSWREARRLLWPHTLLGAMAFAGFIASGWTATLWALPLAGGLLAAIPFCVLSANPAVGRWLREHQVVAVPEECPARPFTAVMPALALRPQAEPD
jgi:membrane glycosyltransferase